MPARSLLLITCVSVLGVTACRGREGAVPAGGRLVLEADGRRILDARATASRCPADSAIAVAVTERRWAAAFSMRTAWPTDSAHSVSVGQILGPGTAVVALRPIADSIAAALVSARGTLIIEPGPLLAGSLDVMAPMAPGAPDSVHVTGRFSDIPVTDDLCPTPNEP
jgi:hypothetical protein